MSGINIYSSGDNQPAPPRQSLLSMFAPKQRTGKGIIHEAKLDMLELDGLAARYRRAMDGVANVDDHREQIEITKPHLREALLQLEAGFLSAAQQEISQRNNPFKGM